MDLQNVLMRLSEATGISGHEQGIAAIIREILTEQLGIAPESIRADKLGNLIAQIKPDGRSGEHILLDAHMDEIGMIVTSVDDKGFLHIANCGGVDRRTLLASEVVVHGRNDLKGIVCCQPPHLLSRDDYKKVPSMQEITIDIGYSAERAKELVSPGDTITLDRKPIVLKDGLISGKSLDDRAGVVTILRAAELLKGKTVDTGVTAVFSIQEEVGTRGVGTAAYGVDPTRAIVVDVSYAMTPDSPRDKCGDMGKGPMIGIAPVLNREMFDTLTGIARNKGIPYQTEVMAEKTGTNADAVQISREGVAVSTLSIPLKYMHTAVETVNTADIENTAVLIAEYIEQI